MLLLIRVIISPNDGVIDTIWRDLFMTTTLGKTSLHLFCTLYWLIFFIVIDTALYFEFFFLVSFILVHCNRYLFCTLNFSSLFHLYFHDWNWSLGRKTSSVVYSKMWLNRVIVQWLFLFDNLILCWVMFELLLFL